MGEAAPDFADSAYLILALEALRRARRPLTPKEMLRIAKENDFLPAHLHGQTMHKTLSARLGVEVLTESAFRMSFIVVLEAKDN